MTTNTAKSAVRRAGVAMSAALSLFVGLAVSAPVLTPLIGDLPGIGQAAACSGSSSTIYTQVWDPAVAQPAIGDTTYTTNPIIKVGLRKSGYSIGCTGVSTHWMLLVSEQPNATMSGSGQIAAIYSMAAGGTGSNFNPSLVGSFNFDLSTVDWGGTSSGGAKTIYIAFTSCPSLSVWPESQADGYGPADWLMNHGGGVCKQIKSGDVHTITYDPGTPTFTNFDVQGNGLKAGYTNSLSSTLVYTATNAVSGIYGAQFSNTSGSWSGTWYPSPYSPFALPAGVDGPRTVYARTINNAQAQDLGVTWTATWDSIDVDTHAPALPVDPASVLSSTCMAPNVIFTVSPAGAVDNDGLGAPAGSASGIADAALLPYNYQNNGTGWTGWVSSNPRNGQAPATAGQYTVNMSVRDNAGNSATGNYPYFVDNYAPASATATPTSPWVGGNYQTNLNLVSTQHVGGCMAVTVQISNDNSHWATGYVSNGAVSWSLADATYGGTASPNEGPHTVYVKFCENLCTRVPVSVTVDLAAPSQPTLSAMPGAGVYGTSGGNAHVWVNTNQAGNVTIAASGSTDSGSGMSGYNFGALSASTGWSPTNSQFSSGTTVSRTYAWTGPTAVPFTESVNAKDNADNAGAGANLTITPDITPPLVTAATSPALSNGVTWYNQTPSVTLSATDAGGSGVALIQYKIDADAVWTTYSAPVAVTRGDGTHTVYYRATDNVGNVSAQGSATVQVDQTVPTATVTIAESPDAYSRTIHVIVTGSDASSKFVGPLSQIRYSTNRGYGWSGWVPFSGAATTTVTLGTSSGPYEVRAEISDGAGNWSSPASAQTTLHNAITEPTFSAGAKIYDCASGQVIAVNATGTVYWSVDRPLCIAPTVVQVSAGSDARVNPDLNGDLVVDGQGNGSLLGWQFASAAPDPLELGYLDHNVWPTTNGAYLQMKFTHETSYASNLSYIDVPFQAVAQVVWTNSSGTQQSVESVVVYLDVRIVVKNSGSVPNRQ